MRLTGNERDQQKMKSAQEFLVTQILFFLKKASHRCFKTFQNLYFSLFGCVNSALLQHGSISLFTLVNVQRCHIAFSMFALSTRIALSGFCLFDLLLSLPDLI